MELNNLMDANKSLKIVYDDLTPLVSSSPVFLVDTENSKSINQMLVDMNHVKPVKPTEKPLTLEDLEYVPLEGTNVNLLVLENSLLNQNSLWCVRNEHLEELMNNNNRFQEYCGRVAGPYTPR